MRRPERWQDTASWLAAPVLLVAVGLVQWWRVDQLDQSSWSGVGFGMFATFENDTNRFVAVTVELDGEGHRAAVPDDLTADADDLLIVPSTGATQELADELAARRWTVRSDGIAVADPDGAVAGTVTVVVHGVAVDGGDAPTLSLVEVRRAEAVRR
jgi:hypothetical protein